MTKNSKFNKKDDVSDVTGCRLSDRLLVIGDASIMFMKKYVEEVVTVKDRSELESEFVRHRVFDRIFVFANSLDLELVDRVMDFNVGTISFFLNDDSARSRLQDYVDANWYPAVSWDLVSNMGKVLITEARGQKLAISRKVRNELLN